MKLAHHVQVDTFIVHLILSQTPTKEEDTIMSRSERMPLVCLRLETTAKPQPVKGNPRITKIVYFENFAGGHVVGMSVATHEPGAACGDHNHRGVDEHFFVLEGAGVIIVSGRSHKVTKGDFVLVPAGAMHNVIASSRSMLKIKCMTVVARGHEGDLEPWKSTSA